MFGTQAALPARVAGVTAPSEMSLREENIRLRREAHRNLQLHRRDVAKIRRLQRIIEVLEEKVQTLTRRLAAMESRQNRFADFIRYMLLLYDRANARLHLLDGLTGKEEVEEILAPKQERKSRLKGGLRKPRKSLLDEGDADEEPQARKGTRVAA